MTRGALESPRDARPHAGRALAPAALRRAGAGCRSGALVTLSESEGGSDTEFTESDGTFRFTNVRSDSDVRIGEVARGSEAVADLSLDEIPCKRAFEPHAGWVGHVEP